MYKEQRQHNYYIQMSRFRYSPQYFDILHELEQRQCKGEYISYGKIQAIIHSEQRKFDKAV
jgi:hypothetical protein